MCTHSGVSFVVVENQRPRTEANMGPKWANMVANMGKCAAHFFARTGPSYFFVVRMAKTSENTHAMTTAVEIQEKMTISCDGDGNHWNL